MFVGQQFNHAGAPHMLELAAAIVVAAVALTFFSDIMSRALKMASPRRARPGSVNVARPDQSALEAAVKNPT